jgi:DNA topoisomerase-6 subunit A
MSDLEKYDFLKKMTMRASEVDLKRAQEMLGYPWINKHKEWVEELKKVIKTKTKLEQDTLQGPRLTFIDDYIREKIRNKEYLP